MTTLKRDFLNTPMAKMLFSDKQAKDIYVGQQFKFTNGRTYTVENVYVKNGQARINVGYVYFPGSGSAPAWFTPGEGFEWEGGTLGEGMYVIVPDGRKATIEGVQPNRVCHCLFDDGSRKSYEEKALKSFT